MDLTGKIVGVMQPRSGVSQRTGNSWMVQEFVLEIPGQYPRHMVSRIRERKVNETEVVEYLRCLPDKQ